MHLYFWVLGFFCFFETGYANVIELPRNKFANVSIVGGTPAAAGEFPNLVVIRYNSKLRCGGTLIGQSHVLTAAHCVYGFSAAQSKALSVMTNTLDLNGGENAITRSVRKIVFHERYNPNSQNNDVAVLVLNSPVQNVKLVSLPKGNRVSPTEKPITNKPPIKPTTKPTKPTTKPTKPPTIKPTTKPSPVSETPPTTTTPKTTTKTTTKVITGSTATTDKTTPTPTSTSTPKTTSKTTTRILSSLSTKTTTKTTTRKPPTVKPITTSPRPPVMGSCYCTCDPGATTKKPATTRKPVSFFGKANVVFSNYANMPAVIAGWGTTALGRSISQVLLKADVQILPNEVCINQYGSSEFIGANMLCAAAPGKDTCQGDSGGPIFVNGIQVGITSWGYGCAELDYAGVYTRVSTYVPWIQTAVAQNPAPATSG